MLMKETRSRKLVLGVTLTTLVVLSLAVIFFSQVSVVPEFGYARFLRYVIFAGCIPQIILLGVVGAIDAKSHVIASLILVSLSWLFVGELAFRVLS